MKGLVARQNRFTSNHAEDEVFSKNRENRSETGHGFDKNRRYDDSGGGGGNCKYRKLDMPLFEGTNPDGWMDTSRREVLRALSLVRE